MSARYAGLGKVCVWKDSLLQSLKNRHGGWASTGFYKASWKRYHAHKVSCVWRKGQFGKGRHRLWCKCLISLLLKWCNALWQRHAGCEWVTVWSKIIAKFSKNILKEKVLGFAQIDIEVPDELYDKFSQIVPVFVVQEILIVIYLSKWKYIRKKLAEKQWREQKNYSFD